MALDWYQVPSVPQWPAQRRRWRSSVTVGPIVPIPNAAAPTFSAYTTFPAWIPRRTLPPARRLIWTAPVPSVVIFQSLAWKSTFPDRIDRRRGLDPAHQIAVPFTIGGLLEVPIRQGWRPIYPAFLWRARRPVPGQGLWNVDMTTLLNAAPCLEWVDEALMNPLQQGEVLMNSDFIDEDLTQPTLSGEDLC